MLTAWAFATLGIDIGIYRPYTPLRDLKNHWKWIIANVLVVVKLVNPIIRLSTNS